MPKQPTFEDALAFVLKVEGGYSNDPQDRGGATNYGVTQKTYDAYRTSFSRPTQDVALITFPEVQELYRVFYWDRVRCEAIPPVLAVCVFDASVVQGPKRAGTMLQSALGVKVDGVIGPQTISAANSAPLVPLVHRYLSIRYDAFLETAQLPGQGKFRQGWINRLLRLKKYVSEQLA